MTTIRRIDPLPKSLEPNSLLRSLGIVRPEDIHVEAIAFYAGLWIKKRVLRNCEAMITGMGDRGIISVNPHSMPARQRFSIAHELGHWAYHRGETVACRSIDIGGFSRANPVERAADQYAADLLMPWPMFKSVCKGFNKLDLKALKEVAGLFGCSLTATLIRMIDSNMYPTTMMVHHTAAKGKKWHKAASRIPGYWKPKDELDPESFAFELLHNPLSQDEGFPRMVDAVDWFDNWAADRYMITEQSFRVPDEGVITILRLHPDMLG